MTAYQTTTASPAKKSRYAGLQLARLEAAMVAADLWPASTQAGTTYTLTLADARTAVETTSGSATTVTIPPNSSVAFPVGTVVELFQAGAGQVTVAAGAGVTLRASPTAKARAQYSTLRLRQRAANEWVLSGDIAVS